MVSACTKLLIFTYCIIGQCAMAQIAMPSGGVTGPKATSRNDAVVIWGGGDAVTEHGQALQPTEIWAVCDKIEQDIEGTDLAKIAQDIELTDVDKNEQDTKMTDLDRILHDIELTDVDKNEQDIELTDLATNEQDIGLTDVDKIEPAPSNHWGRWPRRLSDKPTPPWRIPHKALWIVHEDQSQPLPLAKNVQDRHHGRRQNG